MTIEINFATGEARDESGAKVEVPRALILAPDPVTAQMLDTGDCFVCEDGHWRPATPEEEALDGLRNPAGFWVGADVVRRNAALAPAWRLPVPDGAREVNEPPWRGILWADEPEAIAATRDAWVRRLACYARRCERPGEALALMLAVAPCHDATRGVLLSGLPEAERSVKLRALLRAEGRDPTDDAVAAETSRLLGAWVEIADSLVQSRPW